MHLFQLFRLLNCSLFVFVTSLSASAQETITEYYQVYFDTDKSSLTPDSRKTLSDLALHLDTLKDARMSVTGHTDSRAGDLYNDKLSERRIASVLDFLKSQPILLPPLTSSLAEGEHRPTGDNTTSSGMARNRRVEITVTYPKPEKENQSSGTIQELYTLLRPKPQEFCIDNTRDTLLKCSKGTLIRIPSFAFRRDSAQVCTRIQVTEALTTGDMLEQNLSTSSNKKLLITGGMVEIYALDSSGIPLNLIDNRKLTLFFPADSANADFSTFYGSRSDSWQHTVNWINTNGKREPVFGLELTPSYWTNCYNNPSQPNCDRCKFFNCRIFRLDEAIKGMTDDSQRSENRTLRNCQRALRKRNFRQSTITDSICVVTTQNFLNRGIEPDSALFYRLYGDYMQKRGWKTMAEATVIMQAEYDSINRIRMENWEKLRLRQDSINLIRVATQQLSYNVLQSSQMAMINCDRFLKSGKRLIDVESNLPMGPHVDGKLILKGYNSIMPVYEKNGICFFPNIPVQEEAWALFLKQENGEFFYYLQPIVAGNGKIEVVFTKATPEEIRGIMQRIK